MVSMSNPYITRPGRAGPGPNKPMANVGAGSAYAFIPEYARVDATSPEILPSAIPKIVNCPAFAALMPSFKKQMVDLLEVGVKDWSGIDIELTNDPENTPFSANGQSMPSPKDTKIQQPTPAATIPEILGSVSYYTMATWLLYGCNHPETKMTTFAGLIPDGQYVPPILYSTSQMDMAIIQPDRTGEPKNMANGYFIIGMYPSNTGNFGVQKVLEESTRETRTVNFPGMLVNGPNQYAACQMLLAALDLRSADPNFIPAIATAWGSDINDMGYDRSMNRARQEDVPMGDESIMPNA